MTGRSRPGRLANVTMKRTKPTRAEVKAARDQLAAVSTLDDSDRSHAAAYVAGAVAALSWTLGESEPIDPVGPPIEHSRLR